MRATYSCPCGKVLRSKAAFASHSYLAHGRIPPAHFYASANGECIACLAKFSNRKLLIHHLQRGSKLCLLNALLRVAPLSDADELEQRQLQLKETQINTRSGRCASFANVPCQRMEGPLLRLYDLDGSVVGDRDKRHPYGRRPGWQIVAWCTAAYGEES